MADYTGRRINTVYIELLRGSLSPATKNVLLPAIIRDLDGIPNEELYGVALNGMKRVFVKFLRASFYSSVVEEYQERRMCLNSTMDVCMHDVSTYYTWVRVRNVPFEATKFGIEDVFSNYGVIHEARGGVWRDGYEGLPEGS